MHSTGSATTARATADASASASASRSALALNQTWYTRSTAHAARSPRRRAQRRQLVVRGADQPLTTIAKQPWRAGRKYEQFIVGQSARTAAASNRSSRPERSSLGALIIMVQKPRGWVQALVLSSSPPRPPRPAGVLHALRRVWGDAKSPRAHVPNSEGSEEKTVGS